MAKKKYTPKNPFHITREDWSLSEQKWSGIIKSLKARHDEEFMEFMNTECGYCHEIEYHVWGDNLEAERVLDNDPDQYCTLCPLSKNKICKMGADGHEKLTYWRIANFWLELEEGTSPPLKDVSVAKIKRYVSYAQKILDAIIASKPEKFRKKDKES